MLSSAIVVRRVAASLLSLCLSSALLSSGGVALAATAERSGTALKAGVFEPPRPAPDFALRGSDGAELKLSNYRGKVVLMSFGFTSCPAVCPITLATLAEARRTLGAAAEAMQVIFVTVDPARDDAARMKAYLAGFDPTFVGATGTPDALAAVRRNYGVTAERQMLSGGDYVMDHSSSIYLIDRTGRLRALMPYGRTAGDFVHDVKLLLAQ
jgi:protein SCO1/2